jgi:hypothetical protein
LNEKYKDSSFNGERYRGWVDLQISKNTRWKCLITFIV